MSSSLAPPRAANLVGELLARGVEASDIMVVSPDDGGTFFGFGDPDGNTWAVQEITARGQNPLIRLEDRGRFGAQS